MSSLTCTRLLAFDAAHRVMGHEGKCRYVHGHRYTVEVTCEAVRLDDVGRVVDFGVVKERLGTWLDKHWDHTLIVWEKDAALAEAVAGATGQKVYRLPCNPTAENMARYLAEETFPSLFPDAGLRCARIRVWETPNCYADHTP